MSFCHLREARKRVLDAVIRAAQLRAARVGPRVIAAFHHLLATVQERTTILSPRTVATTRSRLLVDALVEVASQCWNWRRPLSEWSPPATDSVELVFGSVVEHLFAVFPVPRFMNGAWFGPREQHRWYIRLGAGESVRALDLPVRLNRNMAHAFRLAPDDLAITAAFRWAQVRGLGGSPELARAVAMTRLGRESGDEAFLTHVITFIVEQGELDRATVDLLVEFFLERKRALALTSLDGVWPAGTDPCADVRVCALGPKTRVRVLRQWGGRTPPKPRPSGLSWKPAPFGGLLWKAPNGTWRIAELRTAEELRQEGIAMHHCVASYAPRCAYGTSSIWSMTLEEEEGNLRRAVTIEVNMKRRWVCQVKGHANARPSPRVLAVLQRWVEQQGLTLNRG